MPMIHNWEWRESDAWEPYNDPCVTAKFLAISTQEVTQKQALLMGPDALDNLCIIGEGRGKMLKDAMKRPNEPQR